MRALIDNREKHVLLNKPIPLTEQMTSRLIDRSERLRRNLKILSKLDPYDRPQFKVGVVLIQENSWQGRLSRTLSGDDRSNVAEGLQHMFTELEDLLAGITHELNMLKKDRLVNSLWMQIRSSSCSSGDPFRDQNTDGGGSDSEAESLRKQSDDI